MKRSKPLRRTAMKRRKPKEKGDPAYRAYVRSLPCCIGSGCEGRVELGYQLDGRDW